jgi:hypothetical protein
MARYPSKWLIDQLPAYIQPAQLAELLVGFEANKRAYSRLAKIRSVERQVKQAARRNETSMTHWQTRLAELQAAQVADERTIAQATQPRELDNDNWQTRLAAMVAAHAVD